MTVSPTADTARCAVEGGTCQQPRCDQPRDVRRLAVVARELGHALIPT